MINEAFIPPAPATANEDDPVVAVEGFGIGNLSEVSEAYQGLLKSNAAMASKLLDLEPLVTALAELIDRRIERWADSEAGGDVLGRVIEDQLSSAIDSHVEAALEGATVEVDAYIRL